MRLQEVRKTCIKRKHVYIKQGKVLKSKKEESLLKSYNFDNNELFRQSDGSPGTGGSNAEYADLRHIYSVPRASVDNSSNEGPQRERVNFK